MLEDLVTKGWPRLNHVAAVAEPLLVLPFAAAVADEGANIEEVEIIERDERNSLMRLVVALKDRKHLADLIRKLRAIKTVARVMRKKA